MTSSVVGLRRSSKALPKAKLAPKKGHVTVWWSAAGLIHYSSLNPGETIASEKYAQHFDEMHRTPQHLYLALVDRKGPVLHDNAWLSITQPTLQKLNELGYEVFLICNIYLTSHQPNTTSSSFLTTFCRENISTTNRRQKMLSKSSSNPKAQIFMLQE